ncbi:synapse-associated protein 1 isoform X2 [Neocloeon triangulifer]|uniref:synapse-associated protein 1 isoform X2 n=1 Tax=Neocloeon triangulifer TaxID=2078957 RepID=UPI00286EC673|nr:synapse-associated protein 1 isoform X2 [Neocloeon triangulifer]
MSMFSGLTSGLTNQVSGLTSYFGKKPEEGAAEGEQPPPKPESPVKEEQHQPVEPEVALDADGKPLSPTKGGSKMEMLTNVKSQMSSWLGAGSGLISNAGGGLIQAVKSRATGEEVVPDPPEHLQQPSEPAPASKEDDENSSDTGGADSEQQVSENEGDEAKDGAAGGAGNKAMQGAKAFGSFFYSAVNKAGAKVSEAGAKIKETVEKNTILGEFNKEQDAFINSKQKSMEAAVPPWVGYPNEEKLKEEILSLSQDRRSFVRAPPTGVTFEFDYETFTPVAQALLVEDPELEKMRFELVPKVVNEETFWRNYFYRVSLIKQSNELSSLASEGGNNSSLDADTVAPEPVAIPQHSPLEQEQSFVSDETHATEQERMEALQELRRLGVADEAPAAAEWERELQAELSDFELVAGDETATANWESEADKLLQ